MNPRLLAPARLARSVLRTQSDERRAELATGGSDAAFEALVGRHRRALVAHCARVVGADAEEAVQDALMRALAALRRGDEVRRVGPWLHVIAHNVALNLRRTQAARSECALDDVADGQPADEDAAPGAVRARGNGGGRGTGTGRAPPRGRRPCLAYTHSHCHGGYAAGAGSPHGDEAPRHRAVRLRGALVVAQSPPHPGGPALVDEIIFRYSTNATTRIRRSPSTATGT